MKFSNATMLLLLSVAGHLSTVFASAKTEIQHGKENLLRKSSIGSMNLRRRQEEEEEENNNQNDDDYSGVGGGYIAATKCNSYKIQEDEDSIIDMVLKWNAVYGNGLNVFTVPQKSFVFYDYIDPYNYRAVNRNNQYGNYANFNANNNNNNNNNNPNPDFKRSQASFIIDIDNWIQTGATLELGAEAGPYCQQIYNPQEIFQYNKNDKRDDIAKYFATSSLKYNNFFGDWEPKLYLGPICGIGDGALNWGIFLDNTCTTYVPQWTYRYRNALAKGVISYDSDANTLLKLSKYTTPNEDTGTFQKEHHWSCEKGNGLCESLFAYSADTLYCQSGDQDAEDEDRRRLEEAEEAEEEGDDYASYAAYATDDYFTNGYQLSQDDMDDIEDECWAVVASLKDHEGTLEGYLKMNGQLKQHTKDYKKQTRSAVEFTVLALLLFVLVVSSVMYMRCLKRRKRVQHVQSAEKGDFKSMDVNNELKKDAKAATEKEEDATEKEEAVASTKQKGKAKPSSKQQKKITKERKGWFSSFRRKKNQGGPDKTRSLLDKRLKPAF